MRPLLWKEMRDLRWWVVAGALFVGALEVAFQSARVRSGWVGAYFPILMPFLLTVAAVGLGAGQIARERHTRTLDFLLVRPVAPAIIVWMKFLAGSVALALLLAAIVGFGFSHPDQNTESWIHAIHQQVGYRALALALFPRYWCAYALTLFLSVLVDRSAKVAAVMAVFAITLVSLANFFIDVAPFSSFTQWLPFIDETFGLLMAAKSASVSFLMGAVFGAATLAITAGAAALLKRSPEKYLGNPGLAAVAAGIIGVAMLSAHGASVRFPAVPPVGTWEIDGKDSGNLLASGHLAAVADGRGVRFVDFQAPASPKEIAYVAVPSRSRDTEYSGSLAAMRGDTVFLAGERKGIDVNQAEVAIVRPSGPVEEILLGPLHAYEQIFGPVPVGNFLYIGIGGQGSSCRLQVLDLATRQQVASLPMQGDFLRLTQRGSYLYALTSDGLTTLNVSDPAKPTVTNKLPAQPTFLIGVPFQTAWEDSRLFATVGYPESLQAFDLSDPAHPVAQGSLEYHASLHVLGSGRALYRPWQDGILEFHAEGNHLGASRYLSEGEKIAALATGDDYVFGLTMPDNRDRRKLLAFR